MYVFIMKCLLTSRLGCIFDKRSKSTSYNILCNHLRSSDEWIQFLTIDFHVILQTNSAVSTKLFICSVKLYLFKIRRYSGYRPIWFHLLSLNINSLVTNILRGSNLLSSVIQRLRFILKVHHTYLFLFFFPVIALIKPYIVAPVLVTIVCTVQYP